MLCRRRESVTKKGKHKEIWPDAIQHNVCYTGSPKRFLVVENIYRYIARMLYKILQNFINTPGNSFQVLYDRIGRNIKRETYYYTGLIRCIIYVSYVLYKTFRNFTN